MNPSDLIRASNAHLLLVDAYHNNALLARDPIASRAYDRAADLEADIADVFADAAHAMDAQCELPLLVE